MMWTLLYLWRRRRGGPKHALLQAAKDGSLFDCPSVIEAWKKDVLANVETKIRFYQPSKTGAWDQLFFHETLQYYH